MKTRAILAAACFAAMGAVAQTNFKLGNSGPSAGPFSASFLELLTGVNLYLDHVNAQGGVKGRKVELIQRDDNFDVARTKENVEKLIREDKVDAIILVRGTPHNEAITPLTEAAGIANIGPSTGAISMHEPPKRTVFNVRSSYRKEAEKLAYLLTVTGKQKISVVHVDDTFGADAAQGVKNGLTKAKLSVNSVHTFDRKLVDVDKVIPELKRANPDAVIFIGAGVPTVKGITAIREAGLKVPVATVSNNASGGFIKDLGKYAEGTLVSQVFPDELKSKDAFTSEARELAAKKGVTLTPQMMEGFSAAKVAVEGLRKCPNTCTREELIKSLDSLTIDLGQGLKIAYTSTDHTGLDFADLSVIGPDGRFRR